MVVFISDKISSPINFSWTLLKVTSPDMFLKSFNNLGGCTFGTGVTLSIFHRFGQIPDDIDELIIFVNGKDICSANILMIFGGTSPGGAALLVLVPSNLF